jgi:hypothetical protein
MTTENPEYDVPSKPGQKWVPSWIPCPDGCSDAYCVQHEQHAHECDCPSIDEWAEHDVWPYKDD